MSDETKTPAGSLACPRCGKPATELSVRMRKCTRCGCTLAMAPSQPRLSDENALLRLALVSMVQRYAVAVDPARARAGIGPLRELDLTDEDLSNAAASTGIVLTNGNECRVRVSFR